MWFKSSRSAAANECVEIYFGHRVGVRDSKDRGHGPELWFPQGEWDAFIRSGIWRR
ncbi:DUF397 domain-containing protein [Nocardia huaxiensis]|nr:DUF397 domain-containing protein [Nocardia huaxiensis]UFT00348.1 DUF397 domain-containing protein [Nocardia huaxiensis]